MAFGNHHPYKFQKRYFTIKNGGQDGSEAHALAAAKELL